MKYSLRSLMIVAGAAPPVLAAIAFWLRGALLGEIILGIGLALFLLLALVEFVVCY